MEIVSLFLQPKSPSGQVLHRTANRMLNGNFTAIKNRTIETDTTRNMVGNRTINGAVVSQESEVLDQKLAPFSRKFPELIPEHFLTNVHLL